MANTTIHISLVQTKDGLQAQTNMAAPQRGKPLTMEESSALGMLNMARGCGIQVVYGHCPVVEFIDDLLHPEQLGHDATPQIRARALELKGHRA